MLASDCTVFVVHKASIRSPAYGTHARTRFRSQLGRQNGSIKIKMPHETNAQRAPTMLGLGCHWLPANWSLKRTKLITPNEALLTGDRHHHVVGCLTMDASSRANLSRSKVNLGQTVPPHHTTRRSVLVCCEFFVRTYVSTCCIRRAPCCRAIFHYCAQLAVTEVICICCRVVVGSFLEGNNTKRRYIENPSMVLD